MTTIYLDPWSPDLYGDKLFDMPAGGQSGGSFLYSWWRLRECCRANAFDVKTADHLSSAPEGVGVKLYYSIGETNNYTSLKNRRDVLLCSIYLLEPPLNAFVPRRHDAYWRLNELNGSFRRLYMTCSVADVNRLYGTRYSFESHKFHYAQNRDSIDGRLWSRRNRQLLTMINSYNCTRTRENNFYYERLRALRFFAKIGCLDLYGHRWDKIWQNSLRSLLYAGAWMVKHRSLMQLKSVMSLLLERKHLRRIYKGASADKYKTLSDATLLLPMKASGCQALCRRNSSTACLWGQFPFILEILKCINGYRKNATSIRGSSIPMLSCFNIFRI